MTERDDAALADDGSWRPTFLERTIPPLSFVLSAGVLVCAGGLAWHALAPGDDLLTRFPLLQSFAERRGLMLALAGTVLALAGMIPWRWRGAPCPYAPAQVFSRCIMGRARTVSLIGASAILYVLAFVAAYFPVRAVFA